MLKRKLDKKTARKDAYRIIKYFLYCLPVCLFFSYYPVISFGSGETMNFEISLPIIWLSLFDVVALALLFKEKKLFSGLKQKWMWLLFPVWLSLSVIWSLNAMRGVLTVGILWLIYFAGYAMWKMRETFDEEFRAKWLKWFFGATLVVCGWCVIQCVLDLVGVSRDYSLMCAGCTYRLFGFPHPNGFAIEPQFMGNLLLAPTILVAWLLVKKQDSKNLKRLRSRGVVFTTAKSDSAWYSSTRSSFVAVVKTTTGSLFLGFRFLLFCFFIIATTLFLTFSRGAIYAFVVGLLFMTGFLMFGTKVRKERVLVGKRLGLVWGTVVLSFLFTLNMQGVMAQVSPTNDTYMTGVGKVLNHLSLGVIDLPVEKPVENLEENRGGEEHLEQVESDAQDAVFDGYVAESTDIRLKLSEIAVEAWSKDMRTILFGVGLGGAGQALYNAGLSPSPKEIVQNQYVSLLLETGLVGVSLFVLTVVLVVMVIWKKTQISGMMLSLMVAYGVSLCFFAGLPNALQIYLLLICLSLIV